MKKIGLTPRLQCVADCLKECNLLADIGTDHAYIPIYAVQKGIAQKAIASDVVKGPLKIAADNILSYNLENKIITCLANGLESAINADVIVIAGMGGKLICNILEDNLGIAKKADYLIIQPMTCSYELRKFLHCNNFKILDEKLAKEEEKIYNIMIVTPGSEEYKDEFHYHIGIKLFENNEQLLGEYIKLRANVLKKQISGMNKSGNAKIRQQSKLLTKLYERFLKEADDYDKSR